MELLKIILVTFAAGMGAGIGTGLAGLSAAAVISPMLITLLDYPAYEAVGIALASDILASAASAWTYHKNKNLDIKNGIVMMMSVIAFTLLGSYLGSFIPHSTMGNFSIFGTFILGIRFIVKPVMKTESKMMTIERKKAIIYSIVNGAMVGLVCGIMGAGGGMMMLMVLTSVLGYELKTAVGTSVFIMTFTAFTGSVSHFAINGGISSPLILVLCIIFTLLGAAVSAKFANMATPKTLNRVMGIGLALISAAMLAVSFIK
ncbi:MAG: sulfite exporter TauE/SafE family protein [Clostridia bacterium]|nr:sulfite exporter TauE/SafE family protein [Clostridia bacterium]